MLDRTLASVDALLATTPGVMWCVKAASGEYLAANLAFAERAGVAEPAQVVGRTAGELFPADLAVRYEEQDRSVLASGQVLSNELELITRPDGGIGWYVTSKSRWVGPAGEVLGILSISVDLKTPADAAAPHGRLALAVDVARRRFAEPLSVHDLAEAAAMSEAALARAAKRWLGLTPKQLIMRFRLEEAVRLLSTTTVPVADVAGECGYYDQSSFTRHFRRVVGVPPAAYRAAHRAGGREGTGRR
ncbi:MAG: AraC family transcriptional regulator [Ilumatobacteraceae bacterium]